MLVLNRRPGESIVIEPDLRVTVVSVADRRVWVELRSPVLPVLRVSATVVSPTDARLEIVPIASVAFDGDHVRIEPAFNGDAASGVHAGLAVDRKPGERVDVGDNLFVALASISKGNPAVTFGGSSIGDPFSITLIRPAGSYVRLGVDAPNRRVYREELWDMVQASGGVLAGGVLSDGAPRTTPGGATSGAKRREPVVAEAPIPEAPIPEAPIAEPVSHAAVPADMAAGSPAS